MTGLTPDLRSDQRSVAAAPTAGRSIVVWCIQVESHRRQASAVDGDSSQPPHFPTLPRLTSSANRKTPTQHPLRTQQPPCAEPTAARPEESIPGAMTIKALILRANNALFPFSSNAASRRASGLTSGTPLTSAVKIRKWPSSSVGGAGFCTGASHHPEPRQGPGLDL